MTTDLRAALRDTATAWDALGMRAAQPECDSHPLVNPDHCAARAAGLRALADAPLTVAELLPLVDATHEVHWTDADGDEWRVRCGVGPRTVRTVIEVCERGEWTDGASEVAYPLASDFKLPATLVEVTP